MPNPLLVDLPHAVATARLTLRPPRPGDGPALHEALVETLPALRRFLGSLPWVAEEQTPQSAEIFCRSAHANFAARKDLPYFVFDRHSGRLLGAAGLHRPQWSVPKVEVGYWVRTSALGRGYVTEAVEAVVGIAFDAIGALRVELVTDEQNTASRRVAERSGFVLEGVLRHERRSADGELRNTCLYARWPSGAAA